MSKHTEDIIYPIPLVHEKNKLFFIKKNFLTKRQLDILLESSERLKFHKSTRKTEPRKVEFSYLDIDLHEWLYSKCALFIANNNIWELNINGFVENFRMQRYKKNCFTRMHMDYNYTSYDQSKITFVIQLSDPNDYVGGDLIIGESEPNHSLKPGDCILFPSFVFHGVSKVVKGERLVVTGWAAGSKLI